MTNDEKLRELQQLKREKERERLTEADYQTLVTAIRAGEDEYRAARERIGSRSNAPPPPPAWAAKLIARLENAAAALKKKAQEEQGQNVASRGRDLTKLETASISIIALVVFATWAGWPDDPPAATPTPSPVATYRPAPPPPAPAPEPVIPLRVESWNCTLEHGFANVQGEVTNLSDRPLDRLMVVASLYTQNKEFVKSGEAMVEYQPLLPGQTSPFRAMATGNPAIETCTLAFKQMFGGTVRYTTK